MSNFVTVSDTTNLAGGGQINYTLSSTTTPGSEKTLEVLIRAPDGTILASSTNSYDNRSQIQSTINRQLDNKLQLVEKDLAQVQNDISSLTSILNNPNTPPDQIRNAEAQLTIAQEEQTTLEKAQDNITVTTTRFNGTFTQTTSELNNQLIADQQPPPATPTIDNTAAPAPADPTGNNSLQGTASDDSGAQPTTPASAAEAAVGAESSVPGVPTDPSINAPEKPDAERENTSAENNTQGTPPYPNEMFDRKTADPRDRPGKRLKNPLSFLSSYNYQLSLYIITPDAYDAFLANGRRNINVFAERIGSTISADPGESQLGGAFLLAQSGGSGPDPRAPGVKYDYYIDNLSFTHLASAKETLGPTGNLEFNFQIIEPYGFSFVNNLKLAQKQFDEFAKGTLWDINDKSKPNNRSSIPNAKQFFILGIRFLGWDKAGRQVLGDEVFEGSILDPEASNTGPIFETFYELLIYELKYKIDGKATVYNIKANAAAPSLGANTKKGYIMSPKEATGSTVRDYLSGPTGLLTKLNEEQQNLKNNKSVEYPTTYKIKWIADAEQIAISSIISENRDDKAKQPANQSTDTEGVNATTDVKSSPTSNQTVIGFSKETPIIQAIDTLFSRSKFIEDALTINYTDSKEFDPETKSAKTNTTPKREFKWFRITPEISNVNWDTIINDWAYDITYVIETYLLPILDNPFISGTTKYYGPHKRYDYWYTGENSEVLAYEQTLDNQYYQSNPAGDPKSEQTSNSEGNANQVAQAPNSTTGLDQTTAGGTLSTSAAAAVKNALYDPGSYTKATVQILGDPDFLMQESTAGFSGLNQAYSRHYGTGFTIKPTGGYVFFEIDFKEAVDYSAVKVNDVLEDGRGFTGVGGTLTINDSISFWDIPPEARDKVKGISYTLTKVKSSFRNGLFTQTLEAFINDFGTGALRDDAKRERDGDAANNSAGAGGEATRSGSIDQVVSEAEEFADKAEGTTKDPAPGTGQTAKTQPAPTTAEPTT